MKISPYVAILVTGIVLLFCGLSARDPINGTLENTLCFLAGGVVGVILHNLGTGLRRGN